MDILKESIRNKKKLLYLQIGIISILFLILYYPIIFVMVKDWQINDNYSHGYLIPLIVLYMIWAIRKKIGDLEVNPNNWGVILILIGFCQLMISRIGSEYFLQRISMIIVLFGILLFLAGNSITKRLSFPVLYLIFMIPIPAIIWNKIAFPLKLFASFLASEIINSLGITILRRGNILYLANMTLEVVDACSGLRSLTSLLALSAAFAFFTSHSKPKKWLLFLSAIPIAILTNIIRLTLTAGFASKYGEKIAEGFLHGFSGLMVFFLGLFLLYLFHIFLSKFEFMSFQAKKGQKK
ncbi:MAG: exosortase/archaeosortase family protein [bacterium]